MSALAFGQGQIIFQNTSVTLISTNSVLGGAPTGAISGAIDSYYFGLFVAPSGTTEPSAFAFTGNYGTNTTTTGRLFGGTPSIQDYPPGSTVSLLVRGWSANIGHDYADVIAYLANPTFTAWYGESQIGTNFLGLDNPPPPPLFGLIDSGGIKQIPGFTLEIYSIPEPFTLALMGLGTVALLRFRRRSP